MLQIKDIAVATQANNVNIFTEAMQLQKDRATLEIVTTGVDAETKAILKISASGKHYSMPHEDAEVIIPLGSQVINVPFEGLTPGCNIEVYFDKQTALVGTFSATIL